MPDISPHLNAAYVANVVEVVRNAEAGEDVEVPPNATQIMQRAIRELLTRIRAMPQAYAMSDHEFILFNYYRPTLGDSELIRSAVQRHWQRRHSEAERS